MAVKYYKYFPIDIILDNNEILKISSELEVKLKLNFL